MTDFEQQAPQESNIDPQIPNQEQISWGQAAKDTLHSQDARHSVMRTFNAAMGYATLGATIATTTPGIAPKIVGGALIANGLRETAVANKPETEQGSIRERMRQRIFMFADSLIDKNTGKMNLSARLKRRTGEEILNFQNQEFSNRFSRMMGGMMVLGAGIQFADQPGIANKIIGLTLSSTGFAEQIWNTNKLSDHYPQHGTSNAESAR